MRVKNCLMFMVVFAAGSAVADARYSISNPQQSSYFRLEYAQVQVDDLSQSDLRRLIYYADRATRTLQNLVEDADTRSRNEQDKVDKRFRESIVRLADAGARSGLSMDQVADFYTEIVFDNFGQEFIQKAGELAGGLDFRTLFRNAATVSTPAPVTTDSGISFVDFLAATNQDIQRDVPVSENNQPPPPSQEQQTDGPVAFPNANAIELSIVNRIRVNNGRWELTIKAGDPLSTIASAIYGDSQSYAVIYDANSAVIINPNVIEVDTLLILPRP